MGIQNRDYYRRSNSTGSLADWGLYSLTPVVKYIIIANIAVFLLQFVTVHDSNLSALDILRKQDPELDKVLTEKGDDPATLEELKKDYPEIEFAMRQDRRHVRLPGQRVSYLQEWFELDSHK